MTKFILDYLGQIIVGLIVTIIASSLLYFWGKRKSIKLFKYHKSKKRIKEAGIVTFFYDRKVLQADAGTIGEFVAKAKIEVYYVGCWLSSSLNSLDLSNQILEKATKGIKFHFCVISPKSILIDKFSQFFNVSSNELKNRLNDTINMLFRIKDNLPLEFRKNIKVYIHDEIITASFWAIDPENRNNAIIQLDHKISRGNRFNSYGMEIKYTDNSKFANEIKKGYFSIIEKANEIKESNEIIT